jgi:hypothetical protein
MAMVVIWPMGKTTDEITGKAEKKWDKWGYDIGKI